MGKTNHVCSLWQSPFILKDGVDKLNGIELAISCRSIILTHGKHLTSTGNSLNTLLQHCFIFCPICNFFINIPWNVHIKLKIYYLGYNHIVWFSSNFPFKYSNVNIYLFRVFLLCIMLSLLYAYSFIYKTMETF